MTTKQNIEMKRVFTIAHNDYNKGLNVHAFFKTHNKSISCDLVQDAFTKTWVYLVRHGKIDLMKPFLYRVLNNLIVDYYRKHKTSSLDSLLEKGFEPKTEDFDHVFDIMDGKAAGLLIQNLPKAYQKVMRMRYIQDLSLKEMSLITGKSKNTMAVLAHRGLVKLKLLYHLA